MRALSRAGLGLAMLLVVGACAKSATDTSASPTPAAPATASAAALHTADNAKLGKILVDGSGRTLYFFDKDANGTIACVDACATRWPPLASQGTADVAGLGTTKRPDGTSQVTYRGHPLYAYSLDTKAGDTNGDGFAGVWHAAKVT
jgi:predicted lipoprotein with Yx(FWY)xxD motif